jgi:hypothetical protein
LDFIKQASETAEKSFDFEEAIKQQQAFTSDLERFKAQLRQKNADVKAIQDELFNMVQASGMSPAKVKAVLGLLRKIRPEQQTTTNLKNLMKAIMRASEYTEQQNQRKLRAQIRKELKKSKAKKTKGILKGKFTADVQRQLDEIAAHIDDSRDAARLKAIENLERSELDPTDENYLSADDVLLANEKLSMRGITGMTSTELAHVLANIESLKTGGRTLRAVQQEKNNERLREIRTAVMGIVTGGKGLKSGYRSVPRKQLAAEKGLWDKFTNWQYGWDSLLDKLSKFDKASQPFESVLSRFGSEVHRAEAMEAVSTARWMNEIRTAAGRILGGEDDSEINVELNKLGQDVVLGPFVNADGEYVTIETTRDALIKKYMELLDPTLEFTFVGGVDEETGESYGMRWTDEMIDAVREELEPKETAWAEWQMDFYRKYHGSVNAVYRLVYGVDLPFNPFYSPIARDIDIEIPENVLLAKEASHYASVLNGSLKSRQPNVKALKFPGATSVLVDHIVRMEHFKAWTGVLSDMRRVLGNTDIRRAIEQYHGIGMLRTIDGFLQDMARGGIERSKIARGADWLRVNFTKAILGLKPVIGLKQLPSFLGYTTAMPILDFVEGVADFWTDPVGHAQFLREHSGTLAKRWGEGFERDIRFAMQQKGWEKKLSGKTNISDWFFTYIRFGDKLATMQGGWAAYKSAKKAGKSDAEAIAFAEDVTGRTQPTSDISTLAAGQRGGSMLKLWTMFQNQPNKYFRIIANNARNIQYGRGSSEKALYNIMLVWAFLPMLFQLISDAGKFRWKNQLQATLLGPLNTVLIFGAVVKSLVGAALGDPMEYRGSPVVSSVAKGTRAVTKARRFVLDAADPWKDADMDDLIGAVEDLAEAAGQVGGAPTPYIVQAEKALREGRLAEFVFSRYSLGEPEEEGYVVPK